MEDFDYMFFLNPNAEEVLLIVVLSTDISNAYNNFLFALVFQNANKSSIYFVEGQIYFILYDSGFLVKKRKYWCFGNL